MGCISMGHGEVLNAVVIDEPLDATCPRCRNAFPKSAGKSCSECGDIYCKTCARRRVKTCQSCSQRFCNKRCGGTEALPSGEKLCQSCLEAHECSECRSAAS